MRPNDTFQTPQLPQRDLQVPERDAAINVVRGQLDALYSGQNSASESHGIVTPQAAASPSTSQPAQNSDNTQQPEEQWQQYHTAWQNYYQKYYERYYTEHVHKAIKDQPLGTQAIRATAHTSQQISDAVADTPSKEKQEALLDLKQKLITNVEESAKKARKSRHFLPIAAAICVVIVFAFLQYNRVLISNVKAYVTPGSINPQNIVVDPTADAKVGPEPKLIIPKINVDVPVVYGVTTDNNEQMKAMEAGVAHWPGASFASSMPGQTGNTVLAGHSSNDMFDKGKFKFVFVQLDKLDKGDTIYANYEGKRYTYTVTGKDVVTPTGWQSVIKETTKPMLVLVTCTPIGTAEKRLLISAEQVSPDPNAAAAPTSSQSPDAGGGMPGNSPTFVERIFGSR